MFIVIECHGGPECAIIVTDEDGNNKVFDERGEAERERDECQQGIIVEL